RGGGPRGGGGGGGGGRPLRGELPPGGPPPPAPPRQGESGRGVGEQGDAPSEQRPLEPEPPRRTAQVNGDEQDVDGGVDRRVDVEPGLAPCHRLRAGVCAMFQHRLFPFSKAEGGPRATCSWHPPPIILGRSRARSAGNLLPHLLLTRRGSGNPNDRPLLALQGQDERRRRDRRRQSSPVLPRRPRLCDYAGQET